MTATPTPPDRERLQRALQTVTYFTELPAPIQEALLDAAIPHQFEAGQMIYLAGQPATHVYLLVQGWIKSSRVTKSGREQGLMFLRPVDVFGHIGLFTDGTYPASTTALERADVWAIPGAVIMHLARQHHEFSYALIRELSYRIVDFISLAEDLGLRSVEARVANNLLRNAIPSGGQLLVPRREWTTFDEMAVRLGTVRDVLSRSLKKLEGDGLIKVERDAIVLLDPHGLADRFGN